MKLSDLLRHIEIISGASVNIQTFHPAFFACEALYLTPDQYIHHGSACHFIKLNKNFQECCTQKDKTLRIAEKGRPFSGICPYGIWEMVTPLIYEGSLACVIYTGNFKGKSTLFLLEAVQKLPEITEEKKAKLREYSLFIRDFIYFEISICMSGGKMLGKKRDENYYVSNTKRFIDCNFIRNISMMELAEALRVNPGYLGELLKKYCGKSFRQMLAERRILESEVYLKLHGMSVSQVASLCGFEDSNYFSQVFHKIKGMTPREFVNKNKTKRRKSGVIKNEIDEYLTNFKN